MSELITGSRDYRTHAHDTVDNPLNATPNPTVDAAPERIDPATRLGQEGGLTGQVDQPVPGTNLHLNGSPATDAAFVHVAPETRLGQEHVNRGDDAS